MTHELFSDPCMRTGVHEKGKKMTYAQELPCNAKKRKREEEESLTFPASLHLLVCVGEGLHAVRHH